MFWITVLKGLTGRGILSTFDATLLHSKLNELLSVLPPRAQLATQQILVLQVAAIWKAK